MKPLRLWAMYAAIPLIILGVLGFASISNSMAATHQQMPEVYAISNHGDMLDFEAIAAASPQLYGGSGTARYLMPNIPVALSIDPSASTALPNIPIPPDDRFPITDTTQFPWSTVVHIHGNFGASSFDCTGWMLGISAVATAGHCLFDYEDTKLFATNVVVIPAHNTNATVAEPFGRCDGDYIWIINRWQNEGDEAYDYGALTLRCRVGERTGNLGFMMTSNAISGTLVNLPGYPADLGVTTMWSGLGYITNALPRMFYYSNDTDGSQSGAPVWPPNSLGCYLCVVAIHSGGNPTLNTNIGVRITDNVFSFLAVLRQWQYGRAFLPLIVNSQVASSSASVFQSPLSIPQQAGNSSISSPLPTPARPR